MDKSIQTYQKNILRLLFALIFIISFGTKTCLSADQLDTTWWYDHYQNGLNFIDNNELKSAEYEFHKIINKDDTIPQAYYGLALLYDKLAKDTAAAIENLERAIELDSEFIDAYYYLGLIYEHEESGSSAKDCFETVTKLDPHHTEGWIALARAEEKFGMPWDMPIDTKPLEILAEALKFNPESDMLYKSFRTYVFWHAFEEDAIPTLQFLIDKNPSNSIYAFDYAYAMYNLYNLDSCMIQLDSIEIKYSDYSKFEIYLLRSKILFNSDRTQEGLEYYWRAIQQVRSSKDNKLMFDDICYIMLDKEFEEYQATSLKDLPLYYYRFWLSRDPNLATRINERIIEHYQRLKYVRNNFRRFEAGYYNKVVIYKFDHPLNSFMDVKVGDEMINPYITKAMEDKRDLDDRGIIYLRHGNPDNFALHNCMDCPQNLSWQYFATANRPELIFHFSKHSDVRGWYLESLPFTFNQRGDFGGWYALLDPSLSPNRDFLLDMPRIEEIGEKNIENVKVALETETTDYEFQNTLIEVPLEYLCFKGKGEGTDVFLFYGIAGDNLKIDVSGQKNQLSYSTFIGLFDDQWNEVLRHSEDKTIPLEVSEEEWEESAIVELERISVIPGTYHGEFQIQDKLSDNLGVIKGTLNIPDYRTSNLILSDIILSGPVALERDRDIFRKGNVAFSPHMFTAFEEEETIGIYVEVYNLLFDFHDRTTFQVTWSLREVEDEDEEVIIKSTLEYSGQSTDDKIYFNLDLSDSGSGDYELIISIKDLNSQSEASKQINLSVK
jgi:tetratricopeptide (TPR) repeat protein